MKKWNAFIKYLSTVQSVQAALVIKQWNVCLTEAIIAASCIYCNKAAQIFMLEDKIWKSAIPEADRDKIVCIGCTESRLGRSFDADDFKQNAPCNDLILYFLRD